MWNWVFPGVIKAAPLRTMHNADLDLEKKYFAGFIATNGLGCSCMIVKYSNKAPPVDIVERKSCRVSDINFRMSNVEFVDPGTTSLSTSVNARYVNAQASEGPIITVTTDSIAEAELSQVWDSPSESWEGQKQRIFNSQFAGSPSHPNIVNGCANYLIT
jgi:hypothetical protein